MVNQKALNESATVTVAGVASALASVFFSDWVKQFGFIKATPLIIGYTILIFIIIYFFFKRK